MKLIVKKPFSWAHRGCEVEQFTQGQAIETTDAELINVATAEGWAGADGQKAEKAPSNKAQKAAPENK